MSRFVTLQVGVQYVVKPGGFFSLPEYKYRWFDKLYEAPASISVNQGFHYVTKDGTVINMHSARVHHDGSVKLSGFAPIYDNKGMRPLEEQLKTLEDDGFTERK